MTLIRTPRIADPDSFFAELVDAQRDLSDQDAQKMLARLVLLLANHVGDRTVLSEAIRVARGGVRSTGRHPGPTNAPA